MVENSNLKQQARAYAAERGISYTQARREILATAGALLSRMGGDLTSVSRRYVTLQQEQRLDGVLPYPFHISEGGHVGRQDFWRGDPFRLVGFVDDPDSYEVTVYARDFVANPDSALGKHPVFEARDGRFSTYSGEVASATSHEQVVAAPSQVMLTLTTGDGARRVEYGVGHLMGLLSDRDYKGDPANGVVSPEAVSAMSAWLMADPGNQDLDDLHGLFTHAEDLMEQRDAAAEEAGEELDDDTDDGVVAVLDPVQVKAWREQFWAGP